MYRVLLTMDPTDTLPRVGLLAALGQLIAAEGARHTIVVIFEEPFSDDFLALPAFSSELLAPDWTLAVCRCTDDALTIALYDQTDREVKAQFSTEASIAEPGPLVREILAGLERRVGPLCGEPEPSLLRDAHDFLTTVYYAPLRLKAEGHHNGAPRAIRAGMRGFAAIVAAPTSTAHDRAALVDAAIDVLVLQNSIRQDETEASILGWRVRHVEEIAEDLLAVLPPESTDFDVQLARGNLLWALGRLDDALPAFASIAVQQPIYAGYLEATIHRHRGDTASSLAAVERTLAALGPTDRPFEDFARVARYDPAVEGRTYRELLLCLRAEWQLESHDLQAGIATAIEARRFAERPVFALRLLARGQQLIAQRDPTRARAHLGESLVTLGEIFALEPALAEVRSALAIAQQLDDAAIIAEWLARFRTLPEAADIEG